MSVTMKDIARDLNVSIVTVSKVLRHHSDISPKTRERVLRRVKELGYHPNWAARSLVTGRSYTIGLVIPTMTHLFFAEVARGISDKIRRKGYSLLISSSEEDADLERMEIDHLLARQVDALIIASAQSSVEAFRHIEEHEVPYVLVDRKFAGLNSNYVGVDDEEIGRLATEHLIENGCRRIAHIRGPALSTGSGRLNGYRRTLAQQGLEFSPKYIVHARSYDNNAEASGYKAMLELLHLDPCPDGVFCFNDPIAIGAMKSIWEFGLEVPKDIALIGAGNLRFDDLLRVPLSSVDQGSVALGEAAANLAMQLIKRRNRPARAREVILPCTVVVRASSIEAGRRRTPPPRRRHQVAFGRVGPVGSRKSKPK